MKNKAIIILFLVSTQIGCNIDYNKLMYLSLKISNLTMLKYSVEHGANVNDLIYDENKYGKFYKEFGKYPTYIAVINESPECLEYLISRGAKIDYDIKLSGNLLFIAINKDNLKIGEILIKNGININHRVDTKSGSTPLHRAIIRGNVGFVKLLLANGADYNLSILDKVEDGYLSFSIDDKQSERKINKIYPKGSNAIDIAKIQNNSEIVELINSYVKTK